MIFKTNSTGVRRFSLIIGIVAGLFHLFTKEEPYGPPSQLPGQPWTNLSINLGNIVLEFFLCFIAAWIVVRVIAWIIKGFMKDRKQAD